jgi:hypothetical protein
MRDAHGDALSVTGVAVDAFVADVQPVAPALEQLPEPLRREVPLCVRVAREIGEGRQDQSSPAFDLFA